MKKVTWQYDEEVIVKIKTEAAAVGMSAQQYANLLLKNFFLQIKIEMMEKEQKRLRGRPKTT